MVEGEFMNKNKVKKRKNVNAIPAATAGDILGPYWAERKFQLKRPMKVLFGSGRKMPA